MGEAHQSNEQLGNAPEKRPYTTSVRSGIQLYQQRQVKGTKGNCTQQWAAVVEGYGKLRETHRQKYEKEAKSLLKVGMAARRREQARALADVETNTGRKLLHIPPPAESIQSLWDEDWGGEAYEKATFNNDFAIVPRDAKVDDPGLPDEALPVELSSALDSSADYLDRSGLPGFDIPPDKQAAAPDSEFEPFSSSMLRRMYERESCFGTDTPSYTNSTRALADHVSQVELRGSVPEHIPYHNPCGCICQRNHSLKRMQELFLSFVHKLGKEESPTGRIADIAAGDCVMALEQWDCENAVGKPAHTIFVVFSGGKGAYYRFPARAMFHLLEPVRSLKDNNKTKTMANSSALELKHKLF